jgi:Domain of unknown function (DUF4349)
MTHRWIAVPALLVLALGAACANDGGSDSGVSVDEPIGAPSSYTYVEEPAGTDAPPEPAVVKNAVLDVEVARGDLNSAAQAVVDLATSPKVGGFLVSSVVDTQQEDGYGLVQVSVPSIRFESVVGDLASIGDVTRQELSGQDMTPEYLSTQADVTRLRKQAGRLASRIQDTEDRGERFTLRAALSDLRDQLRQHQLTGSKINALASYSDIEVALTGTPPPAPPQKPAFERALETAKAISLAIASSSVLAAGVLIPIGLLIAVLYVVGAQLIRKVKPRLP